MSAQTIVPRKLYTAEDLEQLAAQGYRYELIRGELIEMPPAGFPHGIYTDRLTGYLRVYMDEHDLGEGTAAETGFKTEYNPDTVIAPDWAFVAKERLPEGWESMGYLPIAPDMVLETRSPGDTKREVSEKVSEWLNAGVRFVWEMDVAARTITVHRRDQEPQMLGPKDALTCEEVLPGFTYPLSKLFR
ncbi:MAG TPA: Uma2 family endonuclease [Chthonomonadaceae bacterium]|nr:Uma2 family endonuclease [Chthonomonadaceae bacterium]